MSKERPTYLWQQLTSFFGRKKETPANSHSVATLAVLKATGSAPTHLELTPQAFQQRLSEFVARQGSSFPLVGGKVHLLNFSEAKEQLGDRWPAWSDRVHQTIRTLLNDRLTNKDFYAPCQEDNYVIIFGESSEQEAMIKCARLVEEVMVKFFGQSGASEIGRFEVKAFAARVDGSGMAERIATPELLAEVLDDAANNADPCHTQKASTQRQHVGLKRQQVDELLGAAQFDVRELGKNEGSQPQRQLITGRAKELVQQFRYLESALAAENTRGRYLGTRNRDPVFVSGRGTLSGEPEIVQGLVAADQTQQVPSVLKFSYILVWHASKKALGLHLCTASFEIGADVVPCAIVFDRFKRPDLVESVDRMVLRKAKDDLHEAVAAGRPSLVAIPVHFSTLERIDVQRKYISACETLSSDTRKLLVWEILGAPVASWQRALPAIVAALKPFGRGVFLRVALGSPGLPSIRSELGHLESAGIQAIGLDTATASSAGEAKTHKFFNSFTAAAEKCGLNCYAHGLSSLSLATAAIAAGFDYVSGDAVSGPVEALQPIRSVAIETIYLQNLQRTNHLRTKNIRH